MAKLVANSALASLTAAENANVVPAAFRSRVVAATVPIQWHFSYLPPFFAN